MISNIEVYDDKVDFVLELWTSNPISPNIKESDIKKDIEEFLPPGYFILGSNRFHHGIKFRIRDMVAIDTTPEKILITLEDFIKETNKHISTLTD